MDIKHEKLGELIDSIDNISHALNIPMMPEVHLEGMRKSLPIIVEKFKALFIEITGENPWEE